MKTIVTLTRNNDFRRAYTKGKSFVGPLVVCYVRKNRLPVTRVGITTSKKVGGAVQRNRARRVLREAFRGLSGGVRPGYDLVLVSRGKTPFVKSTEVALHLTRQLRLAGVLPALPSP